MITRKQAVAALSGLFEKVTVHRKPVVTSHDIWPAGTISARGARDKSLNTMEIHNVARHALEDAGIDFTYVSTTIRGVFRALPLERS